MRVQLPYFPAPYPDELLHSVLARWMKHSRVDSPGAAAEALFGNRKTAATWDLPSRLADLTARLPGADVAHLASDLTLAPYYTAYAPQAVCDWLVGAMAGSASAVHLRLGLTASRVPSPKAPRYCLKCDMDALLLHGERYWRRAHQLPGVLVCSKHGISLFESPVAFSRHSRHGYMAADERSCPPKGGQQYCVEDAATFSLLHSIAERSAGLLKAPSLAPDSNQISMRYHDLAEGAGLMRSRERIDVKRLIDGFRSRFAAILQNLPFADPASGGGDGWLVALTRRQRKIVHPLLHILATIHLEGLPDAIAAPLQAPAAFGKGPWPCRNPISEHKDDLVIDRLSWYTNRDALVGVFACECGYEYTRGVDRAGRLGPPRYRAFGPTLRPVLEAALKAGISLRATALQVGLDPKTVVAECHALGQSSPWHCGKSRRLVQGRRPRSKTKRREWPAPRINWPLLDHEEEAKVRDAVELMRRILPPIRITAAAIERHLGRQGWLRHRRNKLPLANSALDEAVELIASFQRRRLKWAIDVMRAGDDHPTVWRALKIAGLRAKWRHEASVMLAHLDLPNTTSYPAELKC